MGVRCEISLKTPPEGVFLAGSTVSGEIKYALSENTVFKRITMSLKGIGTIRIRKKQTRKHTTRFNKARYVDERKVLHDKSNDKTISAGSYNVPFTFKIPDKVPPSIHVFRKRPSFDMRYIVAYYISIKFEKPGFLAFPKRYKKEIKVVSQITPNLQRTPLTYSEQKKLFNLSSGDSFINIKSTILDSVIKAGETVNIEYEVANKSHVNVKAVETKLVETISPKKTHHTVFEKDVPDTDSKTRSIAVGETQQSFVNIKIPDTECTIDSCELAARNYSVRILVELPLPHMNFYLSIPIQVLLKRLNESMIEQEAPPSYWDVMCEDQKKEASSSK